MASQRPSLKQWSFLSSFKNHPELHCELTVALDRQKSCRATSGTPNTKTRLKPRKVRVLLQLTHTPYTRWSGTWKEGFIEQMTQRGGCSLALKEFTQLLRAGCQRLQTQQALDSDQLLYPNLHLSVKLFFAEELGLMGSEAFSQKQQLTSLPPREKTLGLNDDKIYLILTWRQEGNIPSFHFPLPLLKTPLSDAFNYESSNSSSSTVDAVRHVSCGRKKLLPFTADVSFASDSLCRTPVRGTSRSPVKIHPEIERLKEKVVELRRKIAASALKSPRKSVFPRHETHNFSNAYPFTDRAAQSRRRLRTPSPVITSGRRQALEAFNRSSWSTPRKSSAAYRTSNPPSVLDRHDSLTRMSSNKNANLHSFSAPRLRARGACQTQDEVHLRKNPLLLNALKRSRSLSRTLRSMGYNDTTTTLVSERSSSGHSPLPRSVRNPLSTSPSFSPFQLKKRQLSAVWNARQSYRGRLVDDEKNPSRFYVGPPSTDHDAGYDDESIKNCFTGRSESQRAASTRLASVSPYRSFSQPLLEPGEFDIRQRGGCRSSSVSQNKALQRRDKSPNRTSPGAPRSFSSLSYHISPLGEKKRRSRPSFCCEIQQSPRSGSSRLNTPLSCGYRQQASPLSSAGFKSKSAMQPKKSNLMPPKELFEKIRLLKAYVRRPSVGESPSLASRCLEQQPEHENIMLTAIKDKPSKVGALGTPSQLTLTTPRATSFEKDEFRISTPSLSASHTALPINAGKTHRGRALRPFPHQLFPESPLTRRSTSRGSKLPTSGRPCSPPPGVKAARDIVRSSFFSLKDTDYDTDSNCSSFFRLEKNRPSSREEDVVSSSSTYDMIAQKLMCLRSSLEAARTAYL